MKDISCLVGRTQAKEQPWQIRQLNHYLGLKDHSVFFAADDTIDAHVMASHGGYDRYVMLPVLRNTQGCSETEDWEDWILVFDHADDLYVRGFCIDDGMPLGNHTTTSFSYRMPADDPDDPDTEPGPSDMDLPTGLINRDTCKWPEGKELE